MGEDLRREIPVEWFVEGGQRWAWVNKADRSGKDGYIEFGRSGALTTSWGSGTWKLCGRDINVTFGFPPETKQLRRTAKGFCCIATSNDGWTGGCPEGRPLDGAPRVIGRHYGFVNSTTLMISKVCLATLQLLGLKAHRRCVMGLLLAAGAALGAALRRRRAPAGSSWRRGLAATSERIQ